MKHNLEEGVSLRIFFGLSVKTVSVSSSAIVSVATLFWYLRNVAC